MGIYHLNDRFKIFFMFVFVIFNGVVVIVQDSAIRMIIEFSRDYMPVMGCGFGLESYAVARFQNDVEILRVKAAKILLCKHMSPFVGT